MIVKLYCILGCFFLASLFISCNQKGGGSQAGKTDSTATAENSDDDVLHMVGGMAAGKTGAVATAISATATLADDHQNTSPTQAKKTATTAAAPKVGEQISKSIFTYKILMANSEGGFGYDIYQDGKLIIHQPYIPAVSGNQYFKNSFRAETAANLVVYKLQHNIMPPTLSIRELDSLKCL